MKEICRLIKGDPFFDGIRVCGGNTLNCDRALEWYNYCLEYVDEGRRLLRPVSDGEAKPVRLPRVVVRILPDYDSLHLVERRPVESLENESRRRIHDAAPVFVLDESGERLEVPVGEFAGELLFPRFFYFDFHGV